MDLDAMLHRDWLDTHPLSRGMISSPTGLGERNNVLLVCLHVVERGSLFIARSYLREAELSYGNGNG